MCEVDWGNAMTPDERKAWEELMGWAKKPGRKGYPMPMSNAILAAGAELKRLKEIINAGTKTMEECTAMIEEMDRLREQLQLAIIDQANTEAEGNALRAEVEGLKETVTQLHDCLNATEGTVNTETTGSMNCGNVSIPACPSCTAKDAELKRLREALSEMTAARDECCKTIAELRRRAKEGL
jgi:chromosome segregation ATPase